MCEVCLIKTAPLSKIPTEWVELFGLIPGYDPIASAAPGEWFDVGAAEYACDFFAQVLKHAKGVKSIPAGSPFILEPWERALTGCVYGWKRSDGTRRYREVFLYVPKKNGKSAWCAGNILLVLTQDGEFGGEIYSAAASKDQAAIIFGHAVGMVRMSKHLRDRLQVYGSRGGSVVKSIVYPEEMSAYKCLAADVHTADGVNPNLIIADEIHRHKSPELVDVLHKSTAARTQPLTIYATTADYNRPSLCNTLLKRARAVRDNNGDAGKPGFDSAFLPCIFEASKDDNFANPETWAKCNPNLGVTVQRDFLERECRKAQETPSELNNFLRLHLNIVTDADEAYIDSADWDRCEAAGCLDNLDGEACFAGMDASTTLDVSAFVMLFCVDGEYIVKPVFWIPAERAKEREDRDKVPYATWARQGFMRTTPGDVVDYDFIRRDINELAKMHKITEIAADPWNTTQLSTQLMGDGFEVIAFRQGFASFSAPTKELEKLIVSGKIKHDGNPVLRWMIANTMIEYDAAGNRKPSKKKSTEKIDGVVGLLQALGRALLTKPKKRSKYCDQKLASV